MSRSQYALNLGLLHWLIQNAQTAPIAWWSVHGGVWCGVAIRMVLLWRPRRRYVLGFAAFMCVSYAAAFFTQDTTRVFALLAWPAAAHLLLTTVRWAGEIPAARPTMNRLLVVAAILALTSPRLYVWRGETVPASAHGFRLLWDTIGPGAQPNAP